MKLNTIFLKDITNSIYFPGIEPSAFDNCFFNIESAGIAMRFYARRIPAFSRFKWIWKKIANRFKKARNEQYSSSSVIWSNICLYILAFIVYVLLVLYLWYESKNIYYKYLFTNAATLEKENRTDYCDFARIIGPKNRVRVRSRA